MRGALSIFKVVCTICSRVLYLMCIWFQVCTFYGFIIDHRGEFLPRPCAKLRTIEFIGDEDTCAFGNECIKTRQQHSHIQHNDPQGSTSNTHSVLHGAFGWKGRMENVYNGYASILARMLQADAHILAWSGYVCHIDSFLTSNLLEMIVKEYIVMLLIGVLICFHYGRVQLRAGKESGI